MVYLLRDIIVKMHVSVDADANIYQAYEIDVKTFILEEEDYEPQIFMEFITIIIKLI